jgi:hypothetical protein
LFGRGKYLIILSCGSEKIKIDMGETIGRVKKIRQKMIRIYFPAMLRSNRITKKYI